MNYRNRDLLNMARDVPVCMACGRHNDGTIVACHSNEQAAGKGMGIKAHDWAVAFCCSGCHDEIDGRAGGYDAEHRNAVWRRAFYNTMQWIFSTGRVRVCDV